MGLQGEAAVPELGSNFYVKTTEIKPLHMMRVMSIVALACFSTASLLYLAVFHRQRTAIKTLTSQLKAKSVSDDLAKGEVETVKGEIDIAKGEVA